MDYFKKRLYQKNKVIVDLIIRNGYLLLNYIKIRGSILFLFALLFIIVLKNSELDGFSVILYGIEPAVERKMFPIMWLFFLIVPLLVTGDSQEKLLRKNFPIISRGVSLSKYVMTNIFLSLLLNLSFFLLVLVVNKFEIRTMSFVLYVFLFSCTFLLAFQLVSSVFFTSTVTLFIFLVPLIINVYMPYSTIIDGTMLVRFDVAKLGLNVLGLLCILSVLLFLTMIRIKKIDFLERSGQQ
ncbi:hypothetical protein CYV26_13285 [Carnobacterium maltaromaticum]|uniref:hypothetical protein n=1 Tax=Carnobacterium maltaromaticum TaxID=2751 RepID=UPI000C783BC2|nr:hypothetical protein [Carnobacterium maltaromaticum]PLS33033.1 hypothetical protein CYV33_13265 [Carnobacterium maltaromaticum]PLS33498.1 hypothetical protein CYV31_13540 [Carnobacterium maltaromaticum]PLS33608.1 hypothetical protein CYV30_13075 [Carnobacterium maltaromaticum]PLS41357.1 hypothetical protein CYV28_13315 [Carnobacterium maltaromaticum]PLS42189.1 hypothetical protein CYV27_12715 [Carnobacterium maltaromaticum]